MTGYTRNDTSNNIATGNIINSADLDGEFDALQAAFVATTGHNHDGTTGSGAPISTLGPTQEVVVTTGAIRPFADNTIDLGTSLLEFKDLYIDGTANIDSLVADTADINGGTIDNATIATSDITVGSGKTLDVSAGTLTLADNQISGDKVEGGTIAATTITTLTSTTVNATTVDTTNLEVTTLKAKDGTTAGTVANTTGVVTFTSLVATTADVNGGTIDGATVGASVPAAGTFTTLSSTGTATLNAMNTGSATITGGSISGITDLAVADGGTGVSTLTGLVKGNGTSAFSAAVAGTDFLAPAAIGSTVQAWDTNLDQLAGLTPSLDNFIVGSGTAWVVKTHPQALVSLGVTATAAELNALDGITATVTELNYTDGVTSGIQTQLDSKAPLASPTFTGVAAFPDGSTTAPSITNTGDTNTGICFPSEDVLRVATGGVERMTVSNSGITFGGGSTTAQYTYDFYAADALNLWSSNGSTNGYFSTYNLGNGVWAFEPQASGVGLPRSEFIGQTAFSFGSAAAPGIAFRADLNTGIFLPAADTIAFAEGGVESMRIDSSGNLLVGTTSAGGFKTNITGGRTSLTTTTADSFVLYMRNPSFTNGCYLGNPGENMFAVSAANGTERFRIDSNGNMGVGVSPSERLHVSGNILATGNVTAYSDARLKEDLQPIPEALDKVLSLTGYTFTRTDTGERQTGVIAQDVQKVLPEAVVDKGEHLAVAYGNMVGLLIEAIKQQQIQIDELTRKLEG